MAVRESASDAPKLRHCNYIASNSSALLIAHGIQMEVSDERSLFDHGAYQGLLDT